MGLFFCHGCETRRDSREDGYEVDDKDREYCDCTAIAIRAAKDEAKLEMGDEKYWRRYY